MWAFAIVSKTDRLTFKSSDIGKPDAGQNQTTERVGRVDAQGHFRLEGDCGSTAAPAVLTFVNCAPLGYLTGSFDPASKSFTVIVPMKAVGATPGTVITPGGGEAVTICPICWVSHVAERSLNATVIDAATPTANYKVPK